MSSKIITLPITKGARKDVLPFNIDNDAFPALVNAYQWRGRVKRKRGTSLLNRLRRFFNSTSTSYNSGSTTITLDGSGAGNILTGFSLQSNGNIFPGSVILTSSTAVVYTDPAMDGTLSPSGTINYSTGAIVILAEAGNTITAVFNYYPSLPAMGIEDLLLNATVNPGTVAFDTKYSYNVVQTFPYNTYDVSFYKNPPVNSIAMPGYIPKTVATPTSWNGQDYQQFWTVNYQGALWATNGISIPFTNTSVGMQYKLITNVSNVVAGPPATAQLTIAAHGLVVGDFVFINEIVGMTGINFQTGYVIAVVDANNVSVEFPFATIGGDYSGGGIAQYLTNRSDVTKDCLRWYDGDPTNGNATTPTINGSLGWVNFAPPLSQDNFSIADLPQDQYYLVGARMIMPFKDRQLFIGAVIQTSSPGSQVYLQDTVVYSQNGTPYYTASFTGNVDLPTTIFNPLLLPFNQSAKSSSYFGDQTGFGGFIEAGVSEAITTANNIGDVIIMGFDKTLQTRLVYSGNDIIPFNFFIINSELPSGSTFSIVNMDQGVLTRGDRGYIITGQSTCKRFDLDIPDEVFQIRLLDHGAERLCSERDYINEWIYFSYPVNTFKGKFPTQTLQYNYRDNSWAVFNETYTTYGTFNKRSGFTWGTVGTVFPTWGEWNQPWNAGESTLLQPDVVGGNQQGFLMIRGDGTGEGNSLYIQSFAASVVTSPDHCLNTGDFIIISGALGAIGTQVNDKIFQVGVTTENTFILNPPITGGAYSGGALIKRMYVPFIQTKQFPVSWDMGRKTRLGVQQYLFTTTDIAQVQLLIYLSQASDPTFPFNGGPVIPANNTINSSLIYSTVLYTCPESSNLGLTPANTNLQMLCAIDPDGTNASTPQSQMWHRINTSLIGDTVQVAITLSEDQMRDPTFTNQFAEIELHSFILTVSPSQVLA